MSDGVIMTIIIVAGIACCAGIGGFTAITIYVVRQYFNVIKKLEK